MLFLFLLVGFSRLKTGSLYYGSCNGRRQRELDSLEHWRSLQTRVRGSPSHFQARVKIRYWSVEKVIQARIREQDPTWTSKAGPQLARFQLLSEQEPAAKWEAVGGSCHLLLRPRLPAATSEDWERRSSCQAESHKVSVCFCRVRLLLLLPGRLLVQQQRSCRTPTGEKRKLKKLSAGEELHLANYAVSNQYLCFALVFSYCWFSGNLPKPMMCWRRLKRTWRISVSPPLLQCHWKIRCEVANILKCS